MKAKRRSMRGFRPSDESTSHDRCQLCSKPRGPFDSVSYRDAKDRPLELCMRCFNGTFAEERGIDFKHPEFAKVKLKSASGMTHEFFFSTHLIGDKVTMDAVELVKGEPHGYHFQVLGYDPEGDMNELHERLMKKVRRALAHHHLEEDKYGLHIAEPRVVRARISSDSEDTEMKPMIVVDGHELSWDEFGRMLLSFEGWQMKLEIYDASEERG